MPKNTPVAWSARVFEAKGKAAQMPYSHQRSCVEISLNTDFGSCREYFREQDVHLLELNQALESSAPF